MLYRLPKEPTFSAPLLLSCVGDVSAPPNIPGRRLLRSPTTRQYRTNKVGPLRAPRMSRVEVRLGPIRDGHEPVWIRLVTASLLPHDQVPNRGSTLWLQLIRRLS